VHDFALVRLSPKSLTTTTATAAAPATTTDTGLTIVEIKYMYNTLLMISPLDENVSVDVGHLMLFCWSLMFCCFFLSFFLSFFAV
jgi:hypothetical protein